MIPIKAILLNLLSVGSAYGLLVLAFHFMGVARSRLAIAAWLPLFLFVILFGLSMDYHVFILTRVREAFDRGMTTEDAVAHGIKCTAAWSRAQRSSWSPCSRCSRSARSSQMKQLGISLAAAVLIDATIIRGVLLPSTMKLLSDRNSWLPERLGWLPTLQHEPEVMPAQRIATERQPNDSGARPFGGAVVFRVRSGCRSDVAIPFQS